MTRAEGEVHKWEGRKAVLMGQIETDKTARDSHVAGKVPQDAGLEQRLAYSDVVTQHYDTQLAELEESLKFVNRLLVEWTGILSSRQRVTEALQVCSWTREGRRSYRTSARQVRLHTGGVKRAASEALLPDAEAPGKSSRTSVGTEPRTPTQGNVTVARPVTVWHVQLHATSRI